MLKGFFGFVNGILNNKSQRTLVFVAVIGYVITSIYGKIVSGNNYRSMIENSIASTGVIAYYDYSSSRSVTQNFKVRFQSENGEFVFERIFIHLENYRDSINYVSRKVTVLQDTTSERVEVLLCPSNAQEYKVPYDTFVKYCGDTLFWKEKCEDDWYYYK